MSADLESFTIEIFDTALQYINKYGGAASGAGEVSLSPTATSNSGMSITHDLQMATIEFDHLYKKADTPIEGLEESAKKIEGLLMMEETFSILGEQKVKHLVDTLRDLMETKVGA